MNVLREEVIRVICNSLKCPICWEMFVHPITLMCGHSYCLKCIEDYFKRSKGRDCPNCRVSLHQDYTLKKNVTISDILDLNGAGGREMWDQILEQEFSKDRSVLVRDTLKTRLKFLKQEIKNIEDQLLLDNEDRTDESSSSSLISPSLLPSLSSSSPPPLRSLSSLSPSSAPSLSLLSPPSSLSSSAEEDVGSSSINNSTQNAVGWEPNAGLSHEFVMLSFSPQLGNQRLVFFPERRSIEVTFRNLRSQRCRFDVCQCMAHEEFSTGKHYWNVDTSRCNGWAIGVSYAHLKKDEQLGRSKESWCIEWSSQKFSAWHDNTETLLEHRHPNRVRVLLDMDNGDLSFWGLTDEEAELYSIRVEFSAPVRPIFWLYGMNKGNALSFPTPESNLFE